MRQGEISFADRESFEKSTRYIERFSPTELGAGSYLVEFDLEKYLMPLQQVAVSLDPQRLRMRFLGKCAEAVEALVDDCRHISRLSTAL